MTSIVLQYGERKALFIEKMLAAGLTNVEPTAYTLCNVWYAKIFLTLAQVQRPHSFQVEVPNEHASYVEEFFSTLEERVARAMSSDTVRS